MLLIPLVDRELVAQGRVLDGWSGPGQNGRSWNGDESRKQCVHKVAELVIKEGQLALETTYKVVADHERDRSHQSDEANIIVVALGAAGPVRGRHGHGVTRSLGTARRLRV